MAGRISAGEKLPFFRYDTPYSAQNRLRDLLIQQAPLVLVFMNNFGHPVTRVFAQRYVRTYGQLQSGGMAMVVRSRADKLAGSIREDTLPFPLMCDADGVLYKLLDIPLRPNGLTSYSLEAWQILSEAKRRGYRPAKNAMVQLPLTLVLDGDSTVLFCHYGTSLTDLPANCGMMQQLLEDLDLTPEDDRDVTIYAGSDGVPSIPSIREYGSPELEKTAVLGLFDDAYSDA